MDVALESMRLGRLSSRELRERYAALFGERTDSRNRHYLTRRILWRMQMLAEGGLSERARQRAAELGDLAGLRQSAPVPRAAAAPALVPDSRDTAVTVAVADTESDGNEKAEVPGPATVAVVMTPSRRRGSNLPPPGGLLIRRYKGRDIQVRVRADGFEWDGVHYGSLSAVARAVTGSHWSGNLFFNIPASRNARTAGASAPRTKGTP